MKDIFTPADILIPDGILMESWSVIACDQFSSEQEYWERVRGNVSGVPSTLKMIFPEVYLGKTDEAAVINDISAEMDRYLKSGLFREIRDSFIYVERTQPDGRIRKGLIGAIDLEEYSFEEGSKSPVRASEDTVLDRLPPRVRIRRAAPLEAPHIITFIDDKECTVIEPFSGKTDDLPLLYDFDLMEGGGHIRGFRVTGKDANDVLETMRNLTAGNDMLMVMGDGNHSLAAAKVFWDELKLSLSGEERKTHPARKALIEVNNVYDPAVSFEAIHRVLFDTDAARFIEALTGATPRGTDYTIRWTSNGERGDIGIKADCIGDMLKMLQTVIDGFAEKTGCRVDYVHGAESVEKLAEKKACLGLILPAMDKTELFATVAIRGVFPRKSFSVGHAKDKRYYLECKRIQN